MFRRLIPLLGLVLVFAACGDDDATTTTSPPPPTTTTQAPATTTTTAPPPSTTTLPATTTTAPAAYSVANQGLFPEVLPGSNDAHGSGCTPPGDDLPDGVWFGYLVAVSGAEIEFDLACFWTGEAAEAQAAADGAEAFDFYIRNVNPKTFTIVRHAAGTAYYLAADLGSQPAMALADWPPSGGFYDCAADGCPIWLFINDGVVTELVEQYLP